VGFYLDKLKLFTKYADGIALKRIGDITPQVIRQYLLWLDQRGHSVGGKHAAYRGLRTFLRWYADENDLPNSPISKVPAPRVPVVAREGVSPATVHALAKTGNVRDKAIFYALFDTGCRAGEFLSINVDDLNQATGEILLRETKSKTPRVVYLGKQSRRAVRRYLRHRQDNHPALWITVRSERLSYEGLRYVVIRRAKDMGIDPPALHDFRRGFAVAMLRNGIDLYRLAALMGHKGIHVLERYLKLTNQDVREAHRKHSPIDNL